MICNICPHSCDIPEGQIGKCLVRKNIDGRIKLTHYGRISTMAVEPIEKRPLFHFFPGKNFLSTGLYGCNFLCNFCINFKVSQTAEEGVYYSPENLVQLSIDKNTHGIAFTYNEPTVHYEYLMDVGRLAKKNGQEVVIKSNGFVNSHILEDISRVCRAWNIDVKGDEKAYNDICGGSLAPVMESIKFLAEKSHLEISYLVVADQVDNLNFHRSMAYKISQLSKDIPIHLLYCYPVYKMTQIYKKSALLPIYDIFAERMKYVYMSNTYDSYKKVSTKCSSCDSILIDRYPSFISKLSCCGKKIAGIFS